MSGVYLIVWDDKLSVDNAILKTTKGGYPHITLLYSGNLVSKKDLNDVGHASLEKLYNSSLTLNQAYVNTYTDKDGKEWHDVLLGVKEYEVIEGIRHRLVDKFEKSNEFFMGKPHVTHSTYETRERALEVSLFISSLLNEDNVKVRITGYTID